MTRDRTAINITLDDANHPVDVIDALVLEPFLQGTQPYARSAHLDRVCRGYPRVPEGAVVVREAQNMWRRSKLARGPDWTMRVLNDHDGSANVLVVAASPDVVEHVLAAATRDAIEPPPPDDAPPAATIGFWYRAHRPARRQRQLEVARWAEIRRNYAGGVGDALDRVMQVEPATISGWLLLLHGPPGTGKTSALRALAYAWRKWCAVDYVLDPDRLFQDTEYLMTVALTGEDDDNTVPWRLLVMEDCDELIRVHSKRETGQALARLLNLADGLPGQGIELLIAITTNEPFAALHPAIVRPGRCLAQIEVGRLSAAEATAWLGRRPARIGPDGVTLAELFAQQGELAVIERQAAALDPAVGQYL